MSPNRVLGSSNGEAHSDNPYDAPTQDNGPGEISSLDDQPGPTERTALLSSSSPPVRRKAVVRTSSGRSDPASFSANEEDPVVVAKPIRRRPWSLKLDFGLAVVLLYANFSALILCIAAINSPFIAHNALPAHRGSMFVPIWVALLSTVTNVLALLSFAYPNFAPLFSSYTSLVSTFLCTLILILCMSVTSLRRHEGILTLVLLILAILSTLHASYSSVLTARYAPLLLAEAEDRRQEVRYGVWSSIKRALSGTWAFLHVSLPLTILHIAIPCTFLLLATSTVIKTIDSSVEQQGQRWKVDPWVWSRQRFPEIGGGMWETGGRYFQVHLSCRGVGIDDPVPPPFAPSSLGAEVAQIELASNAGGVEATGRKTVRRTILVEGDQGVAGKVSADWVLRMLRDGDLTSGDFETRVCFWDRPGYGFSDNSPSSSTPQMVTTLTQALTLAGEMARLEPAPSFSSLDVNSTSSDEGDSPFAPTPLARSGFILVADRYGALTSSLFATINPRLIHSFLYLNPLPQALHFSKSHTFLHSIPAFFTRTLPALSTELGIWSIGSVLRDQSRMDRVLSSERDAIRGEIRRSWLEEESERDKGKDSISWRAWKAKRGRYPERPTIILSQLGHTPSRHYTAKEWEAGQAAFVKDVIGDGLLRWEKDWAGDCAAGKGEAICRKALVELVKKD